MPAHRLKNYIKTYRKHSGLSQNEIAFLFGWKQGEQLSRYEKRHLLPTLRVALACAALFNAPVTDIFAGANDSIVRDIRARIEMLIAELEKKSPRQGKDARLLAKKLSWLAENHGRGTFQ
jgi:transcriptional regulator with XRE-family HTH domain